MCTKITDANTITVRLNTTLYGSTYVEHSGYQAAGADYGMNLSFIGPLDPEAYYNGLLGVKIIPYSMPAPRSGD